MKKNNPLNYNRLKLLLKIFFTILVVGCGNSTDENLTAEYKQIHTLLTTNKTVVTLDRLNLKQITSDSLYLFYNHLKEVDTELRNTNPNYLGLYAFGMERLYYSPPFRNWSFKGYFSKAEGKIPPFMFNYGSVITGNTAKPVSYIICVEPHIPKYLSLRIYYFFRSVNTIQLPENKELDFTKWIEANGVDAKSL